MIMFLFSVLNFLRFSFLFILRRLFCVYKQGFAALAAGAGVASAIPDDPFSPKLWTRLGSDQGPFLYKRNALPLSYASVLQKELYQIYKLLVLT